MHTLVHAHAAAAATTHVKALYTLLSALGVTTGVSAIFLVPSNVLAVAIERGIERWII